MALFENVRDVAVSVLKVRQSQVTPEATIFGDLGADSLDFTDLVCALETEFEVDLTEEEIDRLEHGGTINDFIALIEAKRLAKVPA